MDTQTEAAWTLTSRHIELNDPAEAIEFYYRQGWTDGLPVVPPTPARVREFLQFSGNFPAGILGVIPARNRVLTAEKVAINAVMADCPAHPRARHAAAIDYTCKAARHLH